MIAPSQVHSRTYASSSRKELDWFENLSSYGVICSRYFIFFKFITKTSIHYVEISCTRFQMKNIQLVRIMRLTHCQKNEINCTRHDLNVTPISLWPSYTPRFILNERARQVELSTTVDKFVLRIKQSLVIQVPNFQTWFNFDPSMDKLLHSLWNVRWK